MRRQSTWEVLYPLFSFAKLFYYSFPFLYLLHPHLLLSPVSRVLETSSSSLIHYKDSQDSQEEKLLQQNDAKQNQQRENAYGVKSRGNQAQASKSSLPTEPYRTHLISPAMSCDSTYQVSSTRETH